MPRKIVLFADGTGNAFTTQESNVWRIYNALDQSKPDQICYYIKGVGTSGFKPFAIVDGATGVGVPSNVRKLYRFLCWNWKPGDEIYLFGFSRGSFTIRTLIGLINSEGLVPAEFRDQPVSHAEMQRNAMAAWRSYRKKTTPWTRSLPTIWLARFIRDVLLAIYHFILRHRSYSAVTQEVIAQKRDQVKIKFLGLFDTVEAFGVPIEELRLAIDWAIWPISFRNRILSDKVEYARHALSLDDERTTFHPIRFDMTNEGERNRIHEVWFSGVHSDVGGGYPDAALAYVPLVWMADEASAQELRFKDGAIDDFRSGACSTGPIHDSRSGLAVFYRYDPRTIDDNAASGGAPIVHYSAAVRMVNGDNYAPITLPSTARVLMPDGLKHNITGFSSKLIKFAKVAAPTSAQQWLQQEMATATTAVIALKSPDPHFARLSLDTVWWRRFAYFALLASVFLFALWPWIASGVLDLLSGLVSRFSFGLNGIAYALRSIERFALGVSFNLTNLDRGIGQFFPTYLHPWTKILVTNPISTFVVLGIAIGFWFLGGRLGDQINDRARLAWNHPDRKIAERGEHYRMLAIAYFMRTNIIPRFFYWFTTTFVLPALALVFLALILLITAGRTWFSFESGIGKICTEPANAKPIIVSETGNFAASEFPTNALCWSTGLQVKKNYKYRIWVEITEPWFDRTILAGVNGFESQELRHLAALPIRRRLDAEWFQLIARIGTASTTEWPLVSIDATGPSQLHERYEDTKEFRENADELRKTWPHFDTLPGNFEQLSGDSLAAAQSIWEKRDLRHLLVSDFIATDSGTLFLYVNDAVQIFPRLGPFEKFYQNNSGKARIFVQRVPLPASSTPPH